MTKQPIIRHRCKELEEYAEKVWRNSSEHETLYDSYEDIMPLFYAIGKRWHDPKGRERHEIQFCDHCGQKLDTNIEVITFTRDQQ